MILEGTHLSNLTASYSMKCQLWRGVTTTLTHLEKQEKQKFTNYTNCSRVCFAMEKIRKKMDEIKDAIVVADASTDEFREKKAAALKTLTEHQLRFEDVRRHKKSLEHRLVVVTKQLKSCSDRLAKCEMHDENETKALEAIESKGEVPISQLLYLRQKARVQFSGRPSNVTVVFCTVRVRLG